MKNINYTGVGSRETPLEILKAMTRAAKRLSDNDIRLRSGGADGADAAFQAGASEKCRSIYIPWNGFNNLFADGGIGIYAGVCKRALSMAADIHPAWDRCSDGAQKLHARNIYQVIGKQMDQPSDFLVCWTREGKEIGGTATAIRLAKSYDIPVFNLGTKQGIQEFAEKLNEIAPL